MINMYVRAFLYTQSDTVLLIRHCTESFGYELYGMVGGTMQQDETALTAVKRKVFEEVGLDIPKEAFKLVHTLHRKTIETELVMLCFKADISLLQKPYNKQPDKHDDITLFTVNQLPKNISLAHKQIIECISGGLMYSDYGWQQSVK